MKFSIIIPAYNADKTLNRCIDSILAQTFHDFEVIVINDGSTDNTNQIIDQYADSDSRITAIHKPNGGVSSARNEGLRTATGEYVIFIDADDYIDKDYLESFSKSDADIIICGFKTYGNIQIQHPVSSKIITGKKTICNYLCNHISKLNFRTPWSKACKLSIIKNNHISFDTQMRFGEDTDFNFRIFGNVKTIEMIPEIGYNYYSVNPHDKWTLTPKEYSYSIQQIFKSIDCSECEHIDKAKDDMKTTFYYIFLSGMWNTSFKQSLLMSWDYYFQKLTKYMPHDNNRFKNILSIFLIPYIKLIKHICYNITRSAN